MCAVRHGSAFVSIPVILGRVELPGGLTRIPRRLMLTTSACPISPLDSLLGWDDSSGPFPIFHVGCLFFTIEL